jgi:hypothetical protein
MVVVISLYIPIIVVLVIIIPLLLITKKTPDGHIINIGNALVFVDERLVEAGMVALVEQDSPRSIASVVIVEHGAGN